MLPPRASIGRAQEALRQAHGKGETAASATWEDIDVFRERYPAFQLEDELALEGGEMSCGAVRMQDAGAPGTCGVRQSAVTARRSRGIRPSVAELSLRISCCFIYLNLRRFVGPEANILYSVNN